MSKTSSRSQVGQSTAEHVAVPHLRKTSRPTKQVDVANYLILFVYINSSIDNLSGSRFQHPNLLNPTSLWRYSKSWLQKTPLCPRCLAFELLHGFLKLQFFFLSLQGLKAMGFPWLSHGKWSTTSGFSIDLQQGQKMGSQHKLRPAMKIMKHDPLEKRQWLKQCHKPFPSFPKSASYCNLGKTIS